MNKGQIKQYYERIEKLLNGANKETYAFSPEEIRQILKWYEHLQDRLNKAIEYIEDKGHHYDSYFGEGYYSLEEEEQEKLLEILKGETSEKETKEIDT